MGSVYKDRPRIEGVLKRILIFPLIFVFCFSLFYTTIFTANLNSEELTESDLTVLKVCEGVIQLFKQYPDSVWPGYDLAQKPFIVYIPEKWALLFNYSKETNGFTSYPEDWPDLGTDVLFYEGQYKHLAGQLAFNLPIDTVEVAAIAFSGESDVEFFGTVVHENFHQYQKYGKHPAFGEIPWEREEKYPIEDSKNTALAYLEMRLLMEALNAAYADNKKETEEYVKQFVAVRNLRWKQGDPFLARYEQGKEINEGTAQYVEIKSISLMKQAKYKSSLSGLTRSLNDDFSSISMPALLLKDFQERITGNSISPEDMPRYRIYPVGSAQGFLLDYFNIDWKNKAQKAGPEFTFSQLLRDHLKVDESQWDVLLKKAKDNYSYEEILASTNSLIKEYKNGFSRELESFEAQAGQRIQISLNPNGVRRSRSSRAKKWLVHEGTRELRSHFNIYSLKNDDLLLQVQDTGLLEENDWDKRIKKVVFFDPEMTSISLDGKPIKPVEAKLYQFKNIEIRGKNFKFSYSKDGTITFVGDRVMINLIP